MEKNFILKTCALGLCAATMFVGGPKKNVEAKEISKNTVAYSTATKAADKKVVSVYIEPVKNNSGEGYYILGKNNKNKIVWRKFLPKNPSEDSNWMAYGPYGDNQYNKNYYLQYCDKLYALDLQTGKIKWSVKSELNAFSTVYETNGKVVEISYYDRGSVVVRDIKTGKLLSSAKNIVQTFAKKTPKQATLFVESSYAKNGIVYVEVDGLTGWSNEKGATADRMLGYLKIDTNNYTIKFVSDVRSKTGIWY